MYKHIMLWKLKESAEGRSKEQNAAMIKEEVDRLKTIGSVRLLECGVNIGKMDHAYDIAVTLGFDSHADFMEFVRHPDHVRFGEKLHAFREDYIGVDYET